MKNIIIPSLAVVFIISLTVYFLNNNKVKTDITKVEQKNSVQQEPQEQVLEPDEVVPSGLQANWVVIRNPAKLHLISNLNDSLTAGEARNKFGCTHITSAAFYGENGEYLGYFVSDSEVLSGSQKSSLFNGYFYIKNNTADISLNEPAAPRIAFQTGPVLFWEGKPRIINTANDKDARRMVAAIDAGGNIYLMVFYNRESVFIGPKLTELPEIIADLNNDKNLKIVKAVNLDGGGASAFMSAQISLQELSKVGSFLCFSEDLTIY
jgi:exopolysaccharide biosynthesis protein